MTRSRLLLLASSAALVASLSPLAPYKAEHEKKLQHLDASGEFTYLGDLNPTSQSVGWGEYWTNRAWYDNGFSIAGIKYDNGVFTYAPADVRYHLGKKFRWFAGCVGLDDMNGAGCKHNNADGVHFKVFTDGNMAWDQKMAGGDAARCFRIDVLNVATLQLVADERTNTHCDEASWVNTKLYEDPVVDCEQIGDLTPSHHSVGYDAYQVDPTWYQHGFYVAGVEYGSGIFAHANSHIVFPLHGKYHSFHGCGGVDDKNHGCNEGAHFSVQVGNGGKPDWERQITRGQSAQCFSLNVRDAFSLTLATKRASSAQSACDHTEWVNADLCITTTLNTKVDCVVEQEWGKWSDCSQKCGTGYMSRSRAILTEPQHGGKHCPRTHEVSKCNVQPCPIDCVVSDWGSISSCTRTCGGGYRTRFRSVRVPTAFNGTACPPLKQEEACSTENCPVDCVTSSTNADGSPIQWSQCSATCGGGQQTKKLRIVTASAFNGAACPAQLTQHQDCNLDDCPVDCKMGKWQPWSKCDKPCGSGIKTRERSVERPASNNGAECPESTQTLACNEQKCAIDCKLHPVSDWGSFNLDGSDKYPCSRTCGGGHRTRYMSIDVAPAYGGTPCPSLEETEACNTQPCPIDCQLSQWGSWSICDKTCGGGVSERRRTKVRDAKNNGASCSHKHETRECNKHECPVDCTLSNFGDWGWNGIAFACSESCGGGVQTRSKTVVTTAEFGGKQCADTGKKAYTEQQGCNVHPCPIDCALGSWTSWSDCSQSCGTGWQTRSRSVTRAAAHGGKDCATEKDEQKCNPEPCPVPCEYSAWSSYDFSDVACSRTCGGGTKTRTRSITQQASHGAGACGATEDKVTCNDFPCPQDCLTSPWTVWSDCTATCGTGHQTRKRTVERPANNNGKSCGDLSQERSCDAGRCNENCHVGTWAGWTTCSAQCGGGMQTRSRNVRYIRSTDDEHACPVAVQTRQCQSQPCDQDCVERNWGDWSPCTKSCGTGWKKRHRTILKYRAGNGKQCGALAEIGKCGESPCPVHCLMTAWSFWGTGGEAGACSAKCGGGQQTRTRSIVRESDYGGRSCTSTSQQRTCNAQPCPVDCALRELAWTDGECSATCGGGVMQQYRFVKRGAEHGGLKCPATTRMVACNQHHCPVDCKMSRWSTWTACSVSCGGAGTQTRRRGLEQAAQFGGATCGRAVETRDCGNGDCPVHCDVGDWGSWTACPTPSCRAKVNAAADASLDASYAPAGIQTRSRSVKTSAANGGYTCPKLEDQRKCNTKYCPQNCEVTDWGAWGVPKGMSYDTPEGFKCSEPCGGGRQTRTRQQTMPAAHGGAECPSLSETQPCNVQHCPIDCEYTEFGWMGVAGEWSECSRECGGGIREQRRTITVAAAHGGKPCPARVKVESCNNGVCAVDCMMSNWGWFSQCSKECGGGKRTRSRVILVQAQGSGVSCTSKATTETKICNDTPCPVNCVMDTWEQWGSCSEKCGTGTHSRVRVIKTPMQNGGTSCPSTVTLDGREVEKETKNCKILDCPINCAVGSWGGYDECDVGCGGGIKRRYRTVDVTPDFGGSQCPPLVDTATCNTHLCPVHCTVTDFGDWNACSRECGTGTMSRARTVVQHAQNGGKSCPDTVQERACNTKPCPVACEVSAWGSWSSCSVTCDMGFKFRTRTIASPARFGGKECGVLSETGFCNQDVHCPVDCKVAAWSGWSQCSKTCGDGEQTRKRKVTRPNLHGGLPCGSTEETQPCFKETCPIDCAVHEWGAWGNCQKNGKDVSCGPGVRSRSRTVDHLPGPKGKACPKLSDSEDCDMGLCPIHCVMSGWTVWSRCDKACVAADNVVGKQTRTRTILQKDNGANGAVQCGSQLDVKKCNDHPCAVHCVVSDWASWGGCSKDCGGGIKIRSREVTTKPEHGGARCPALAATMACNVQSCPRDCVVGAWGSYSQCTRSCNTGSGAGTKFATRRVVQQQSNGGETCAKWINAAAGETLTKKVVLCNDRPCPRDCGVTKWSAYSACSMSCTEVIKQHATLKGQHKLAWHSRTRKVVLGEEAKFGGRGCPHLFEKTTCNSLSYCMSLFYNTAGTTSTAAPKDWNALLAASDKTHDLENGVARARKSEVTTTSTAPVITVPDTCTLTDGAGTSQTVAHGWHGAGIGANWCNLCRCNDGAISCQKRKCGSDGLERGELCSHTTCSLQQVSSTHKLVKVSHNHREQFGAHHHCAYMLSTDSCRCHCFGNTFTELEASKK